MVSDVGENGDWIDEMPVTDMTKDYLRSGGTIPAPLPLVMCARCLALAPAASLAEADAWLDDHDCPGVAS